MSASESASRFSAQVYVTSYEDILATNRLDENSAIVPVPLDLARHRILTILPNCKVDHLVRTEKAALELYFRDRSVPPNGPKDWCTRWRS